MNLGNLAVALVALALTGAASAQVYKCVDAAGRITYQQQPCAGAQKSTRMELTVRNGSAQDDNDDASEEWNARVKAKQVVAGMPRSFVMQAIGSPQEMRAGRAGENATEVWVYRTPERDQRVGFKSGVVAWVNDTPPAGLNDTDPANAGSPRQALREGAVCSTLERDLGAAESIVQDYDASVGRNVVRYTWAPTLDDQERTVALCDQDVVIRIDRTVRR